MVEADNVSMKYNRCTQYALEDVSFSISRGEFVFIVGSRLMKKGHQKRRT